MYMLLKTWLMIHVCMYDTLWRDTVSAHSYYSNLRVLRLKQCFYPSKPECRNPEIPSHCHCQLQILQNINESQTSEGWCWVEGKKVPLISFLMVHSKCQYTHIHCRAAVTWTDVVLKQFGWPWKAGDWTDRAASQWFHSASLMIMVRCVPSCTYNSIKHHNSDNTLCCYTCCLWRVYFDLFNHENNIGLTLTTYV